MSEALHFLQVLFNQMAIANKLKESPIAVMLKTLRAAGVTMEPLTTLISSATMVTYLQRLKFRAFLADNEGQSQAFINNVVSQLTAIYPPIAQCDLAAVQGSAQVGLAIIISYYTWHQMEQAWMYEARTFAYRQRYADNLGWYMSVWGFFLELYWVMEWMRPFVVESIIYRIFPTKRKYHHDVQVILDGLGTIKPRSGRLDVDGNMAKYQVRRVVMWLLMVLPTFFLSNDDDVREWKSLFTSALEMTMAEQWDHLEGVIKALRQSGDLPDDITTILDQLSTTDTTTNVNTSINVKINLGVVGEVAKVCGYVMVAVLTFNTILYVFSWVFAS